MPVDDLTPILEVIFNTVKQSVFIDNLGVRVIGVSRLLADVVFLDYFVDGEVVETAFLRQFFGEGCFADLRIVVRS